MKSYVVMYKDGFFGLFNTYQKSSNHQIGAKCFEFDANTKINDVIDTIFYHEAGISQKAKILWE